MSLDDLRCNPVLGHLHLPMKSANAGSYIRAAVAEARWDGEVLETLVNLENRPKKPYKNGGFHGIIIQYKLVFFSWNPPTTMEVYGWETPHILQQAVMTPEGNPPSFFLLVGKWASF